MQDSSKVGDAWGAVLIGVMWGLSQVEALHDFSRVELMRDLSRVKDMVDSSEVLKMVDRSEVDVMNHDSTVREMWMSSATGNMRDRSRVEKRHGSPEAQDRPVSAEDVAAAWKKCRETVREALALQERAGYMHEELVTENSRQRKRNRNR